MDYNFELNFKVRDYECDLQGIVNNSVYQNYLEHTRHEFINSVGLNFANLYKNGINAVVVRIEIDYKLALRSGDEFVCKLRTGREGSLKFVFHQDIFRSSDNKQIIKAKVIAACIDAKSGRPIVPEEFIEVFGKA